VPKRIASLAIILTAALACLAAERAAAIQAGDILVADRGKGLILVDPVSGGQTLFAGPYNAQGFVDVAADAAGNIFAVVGSSGVLVRIDPGTGANTPVSTGGHLQYPRTVDLAPDGILYVCEGGPSGGVIRIDPTNGAQTVILNATAVALTIGPSGMAYVMIAGVFPDHAHLHRLDLTTGGTVPVTSTTFLDPRGLATDAAGNVIVTDYSELTVKRVDPVSGSVTLVSPGGQFMAPWGVTVEGGGPLIVADTQGLIACNPQPGNHSTCHGAVFRIDPETGAQTLLSDQALFGDITGTEIYRGPTGIRSVSWGRLKTIYR